MMIANIVQFVLLFNIVLFVVICGYTIDGRPQAWENQNSNEDDDTLGYLDYLQDFGNFGIGGNNNLPTQK